MLDSGMEAGPQLRIVGAASVERPTLSLALSALATIALVPAFWLFAPESTWVPSDLALALGGIALVGYFSALILDRTLHLDAGIAAALVAVVFLGPLPAACIWIGTELVAWMFERHRPGPLLSTVASYGWAALAAGFVLEALLPTAPGTPAGVGAYLAVALAGVVMLLVNFFVGPGSLHALRCGKRVSETVRQDLIPESPATMAMILAGTLTALLYVEVGYLALTLFALVVVVPQLVLPALIAPRPVSELDHSTALRIYAQAIADQLGLGRKMRLVLKDAAQFIRGRLVSPRDGTLSDLGTGHRLALVESLLYYREHYDGHGGTPGAVGGEMIPLASRILAVADAWSGLTSSGSPGLTHAQALNQIEARANMHFDPQVVDAALKVVRGQRLALPGEIAYQPRLQHLALPEFTRRALAYAGHLLNPLPAAASLPSRRLS